MATERSVMPGEATAAVRNWRMAWQPRADRTATWLVLAGLLSIYPAFDWIARRAADGSDEPWGLLALVTALLLVLRQRRAALRGTDHDPTERPRRLELWLPALLLFSYAASYPFLTPLPRGVLAVSALAALLSACYFRCRLQWGLWGMLLLSLPCVASLQFYLGYPLRRVVAEIAAASLNFHGLGVQVEGVGLRLGEQLVMVDAPCSGIKMLWAAAFVACLLALVERLRALRAFVVFAAAGFLVLLANALRAAALSYAEIEQVPVSDAVHTAVGLAVFAAALGALFPLVRALSRRQPCPV